MAIITESQKKTVAKLQGIAGKRLRAARCAAGVSEADASKLLGQKNATQLSLCESGQRLMPLANMYRLAEHYVVSMDYLLGRINDPLSDPVEHNQGLLARSIGASVNDALGTLTDLLSRNSIQYMRTQRDDRADLKVILHRLKDLTDAMSRFKQLNPSFEDEMRGGARVDALVNALSEIAKNVSDRIESEEAKKQRLIAFQAEASEENAKQLLFPLADIWG